MSKSVAFNMPAPKADTAAADAWVGKGVEPHLKAVSKAIAKPAGMKRLTLDISADLHARVKMGCLQREKTMLEVICEFLEVEFPAQS